VVLYDRSTVGEHPWPAFVACVILLVPALLFLLRGRERSNVLIGTVRAREAEELVSLRDRELDSVASLARSLARTQDPVAAGRALLDEIETLLDNEFAALALIGEDGREAHGVVARSGADDVDWWATVRIDLRNEPSGISSAYFEAAPVFVFDVESSPLVSRRLAEKAGAEKRRLRPADGRRARDRRARGRNHDSAARVHARGAPPDPDDRRRGRHRARPHAVGGRAGRGPGPRAAGRDDLAPRPVHPRPRRADQRRRHGDRSCPRRVALLPAPRRARRAAPDARGVVGRGARADRRRRRAAPGLEPRARCEQRTVSVADVDATSELDDPILGGRQALERLGSRAALATPVVAFDRMLGVLGLHRTDPIPWSEGDIALAESVAHEIALAIHMAGLLAENERRLGEQAALLQAAQVVTSELELDAVLQRLVDEVAGLLQAEAVDCFLLDTERDVLCCAAVHGLPNEMVGFEFPADRGLAGRAIARGRSALADDYTKVPETVPHAAYEGFHSAIVAPMRWAGEVKGVLGVGTRESTRRLTRAEGELLEAFANLAALALRNAESFEEHSRQARVQRGFYRIAAALGEPVSLEATLDALAQAAAEALGGSSAAVLMPRNDDLRLAGLHSLAAPLVRFLENGLGDPSGPLRSAARRRRVLAAPSLRSDERFGEDWRRVLEESGCRALLAAPVETPRSEEAALVIVFFAQERRFADDDLELTRNLTGAARGALERSELFESERQSRALAEQLARTSNLLSPDLDPAAVLEEVVRRAPELLSADAAVVRLLEGDELVVGAVSGDGAPAEARLPSTSRLAGDAVQSRAPVVIADAREDNRLLQADPVLASGYAGYLAVPLIGPEGTVHGVLSVYSREPRQWSEDETKALTAFASNASGALSGAELYQRVALERERSVAILANIADGSSPSTARERRALERRLPRRSPASRGRGARPGAARSPAARARVSGGRRLSASASSRSAAVGRGSGSRSPRPSCAIRRRGRRPHLRLPRHLGRARRRADEVGVRRQRLPRAALAADLDLRLRRDAAARRRSLRRGGARDVPRYIASEAAR
jgi:GAF domain-containing protein